MGRASFGLRAWRSRSTNGRGRYGWSYTHAKAATYVCQAWINAQDTQGGGGRAAAHSSCTTRGGSLVPSGSRSPAQDTHTQALTLRLRSWHHPPTASKASSWLTVHDARALGRRYDDEAANGAGWVWSCVWAAPQNTVNVCNAGE